MYNAHTVFENYIATQADLAAIECGIGIAWHKRMRFVFRNQTLLAQILVVSYDGKYLYVWQHKHAPHALSDASQLPCHLPTYQAYQFPHRLKITDRFQFWWRAGLLPTTLVSVVAKLFKTDNPDRLLISGGLLHPFLTLQTKRKRAENPYATKDGYIATIVHEFAHSYYTQHHLWRYASTTQTLSYLQTAAFLYERQGPLPLHTPIRVPNYNRRHTLLEEAFAFCAEYSAAERFWPSHQQAIDRAQHSRLTQLLTLEQQKQLEGEISVLETLPGHDFAAVIGKVLLVQSPKTWPSRLLHSDIIR